MAKLTLNNITSGFASNTALNANFDLIEAALENTVSRDGTTPNQMTADLDMNGNRILNALASTGEGFVWRGTWVTGQSYTVNDLVYDSGSSYICLVSHTASAVFGTDLGTFKWQVIAAQGAAGAGTGDMLKADNLSGVASAATSRANISAAKSGANSDITSLTGLTTPLTKEQGGTGLASVGSSGNVLTSNGSTWVSSSPATGRILRRTIITPGSGTWTKPSDTISVFIRCHGPGGGGGGHSGSYASGGGAGGYSEKFIASASASYAYSVGTGGAGGVGVNNGASGSAATTIAGMTANPGSGGSQLGTTTTAGGSSSGGDVNSTGSPGDCNAASGIPIGGNGGAGTLGGAGRSATPGTAGFYGSGGGGGVVGNGGNGGDGFIDIWEYA